MVVVLGGGSASPLDFFFILGIGSASTSLRRNATRPLAIAGAGPDLLTETRDLREHFALMRLKKIPDRYLAILAIAGTS